MVFPLIMLLVLPALFIVGIWRASFRTRAEWAFSVLVVGSYLLFIFLTGRWDFFSYYLRYLLVLAFGIAAFRVYRNINPRGATHQSTAVVWGKRGAAAIFALALGFASIQALSGYSHSEEAIELAFPLRQGTYYVGGGGNHRFINGHQAYAPQRYALDIIRLNAIGSRARGLSPAELDRYVIFGDSLFSPCTGEVLAAHDGLPDLPPPERDPVNLAGNHVVIGCAGVKVLLAHLQRGSVRVQGGDSVVVGQPVGQVGNSGNTSQPHLHIHAERGGSTAGILDGEGVPIRFGGRFLVRNDVVRKR